MVDNERFIKIRDQFLTQERTRTGIGTLGEKNVHAILKRYFEPDEKYQEISIEGYVADIYRNHEIIEIQNGNFNKLRKKLECFLPLYPVTVVYPMMNQKWLIWVDEDTGELSAPRKSPKTGSPYEVFLELYKIKNFLKDKNFRFRIVFMDIDEYRLLNGWSKNKKKGSTREERYPKKLVYDMEFTCLEDYMQLVPYEMPEHFTVKDYAKAAGIRQRAASTAVLMLHYIGVIKRIGKKGKAYVYEVQE